MTWSPAPSPKGFTTPGIPRFPPSCCPAQNPREEATRTHRRGTHSHAVLRPRKEGPPAARAWLCLLARRPRVWMAGAAWRPALGKASQDSSSTQSAAPLAEVLERTTGHKPWSPPSSQSGSGSVTKTPHGPQGGGLTNHSSLGAVWAPSHDRRKPGGAGEGGDLRWGSWWSLALPVCSPQGMLPQLLFPASPDS